MKPTPRTLAIGDIHGCDTALATLVDGLTIEPHDTVVVLGDVIDRGPNSRGVIAQLIELGQRCRLVCIQGNHEQMLIDVLDGLMPLQEWLIHGGAQTLDSYAKGGGVDALDPVHVEYLRTFGDVFEADTHFFAHGNYISSRPLTRQPWRDLRWQSLKWHAPGPHVSGKTCVLGHTSNKQGQILNLGHLLCIDTFCHGGLWLTAFDAGSGLVWQANEEGEFRAGELPPIQTEATLAR